MPNEQDPSADPHRSRSVPEPDPAVADDLLAFRARFAATGQAVGRVVVVSRGFDTVRLDDGTELLTSRATTAFRTARFDSPPAVGDWVAVEHDGSTAAITAIAPRHGVIVRRDPADRVSAQVVAANVDTVFCVFALDRPLSPRRVERVLVLVHEGGAEPVVVLTKADLGDGAAGTPPSADAGGPAGAIVSIDDARRIIEQVSPGTGVVEVSSRTGAGLDRLARYLRPGDTAALLGASGAGKSSLVNALVGGDEAAVGDVRGSDRRGRHTTTARRLFVLPGGGALIDTPGLRALGLWDAGDGVDDAFADVVSVAEACRFRDCRHGDEPGCAVAAAVAGGDLSPGRLEAYRSLRAEMDTVEAKKEASRRLRGEGRRPALRRSRRRASVDHDEDEASGHDDGEDEAT